MRRTKIVATLGPAVEDEAKLKSLIEAGVDVVRLNFSHGSHEDHSRRIEQVRRISKQIGRPIGILQDLCGPKVRAGKMDGAGMTLVKDQVVEIVKEEILGKDGRFTSECKELIDDVKIADRLLLDDGLLELEVVSKSPGGVKCKVITGGLLKTKKGINLPGTVLNVKTFTDKDQADLLFGLKQAVDFVAMSFVRKAADLKEVREFMKKNSATAAIPYLIAKIETPQALEAIDEIIEATDGIMVARGDLGVELKPEQVPPIQKELIRRCHLAGKPVITATQMLESMISNPRPTRAEVSDVANAVLEGTDAVMLSGESASGQYPVEAVSMMSRICRDAELYMFQNHIQESLPPPLMVNKRYEALASGIVGITRRFDVKFVAMFTQNGNSAETFSKFRFQPPIAAFTQNERTARKLALMWGVTAIVLPNPVDERNLWDFVCGYLSEKHLVKKGDYVVLTCGIPLSVGTNTIQINQVETSGGFFGGSDQAIVTDAMTIRFDTRL